MIYIILVAILILGVWWLWEDDRSVLSNITIRDSLLPTPRIMAEACDQNNMDYMILNKRTLMIGDIIQFNGSVSNLNQFAPRHIAMNKRKCSTILNKNRIPVPKFQNYPGLKSVKDIDKIVKNLNIPYPLVIKPSCGQSGIHIHVGIQDESELRAILETYINLHDRKIKCDEIMIEEYVPGDNYRFLYFDDQLLDIVKREIPYVIGDGETDLGTLIRRWNLHRKKDGLNQMKVDWKYIQKYGITKNTVISDGVKYTVKQICGCCISNYIRVDPRSIDSSILNKFKNVGKIIGLRLYGLDVISTDLSKPNTTKINEVNSAPSMRCHYYRDIGYLNRQRDLTIPIMILDKIIEK